MGKGQPRSCRGGLYCVQRLFNHWSTYCEITHHPGPPHCSRPISDSGSCSSPFVFDLRFWACTRVHQSRVEISILGNGPSNTNCRTSDYHGRLLLLSVIFYVAVFSAYTHSLGCMYVWTCHCICLRDMSAGFPVTPQQQCTYASPEWRVRFSVP